MMSFSHDFITSMNEGIVIGNELMSNYWLLAITNKSVLSVWLNLSPRNKAPPSSYPTANHRSYPIRTLMPMSETLIPNPKP
jgi:hypothetical protein